jgi:hypothetical protein
LRSSSIHPSPRPSSESHNHKGTPCAAPRPPRRRPQPRHPSSPR